MMMAPPVQPDAVMAVRAPRAPQGRLAGAAQFAASATLHLALLALLILAGIAALPPPAPEEPLDVEMIGAREFEGMRPGRTAPVETAPASGALMPDTPRQVAPTTPTSPPMIRPSRLLAQGALEARHNQPLRRQMAGLADEERIAQLCDLEAMEQIHAWKGALQPDRLVDYALSDPQMREGAFIANGAAFRAAHQWYELSYRCELDAGAHGIVGFSFRVGEPIPREEWTALNLPATH